MTKENGNGTNQQKASEGTDASSSSSLAYELIVTPSTQLQFVLERGHAAKCKLTLGHSGGGKDFIAYKVCLCMCVDVKESTAMSSFVLYQHDNGHNLNLDSGPHNNPVGSIFFPSLVSLTTTTGHDKSTSSVLGQTESWCDCTGRNQQSDSVHR